MAQYTSSQILAGSAAELQAVYGAEWVRRWARTRNFSRWVSDNSLSTAARLWRARLEAAPQEARPNRNRNPNPNLYPDPNPTPTPTLTPGGTEGLARWQRGRLR